MFGENEIRSNNKVYKAGDYLVYYIQSSTYMCQVRGVMVDETDGNMLKLKVDQLLSHENLPNCHSTDNRHIRESGKELWLVEGEAKFINPQNIERHITVWLRDMPELEEYDYFIQKIQINFEDFIKPVLQDTKCLESDLVMKTINGDVWIIGELGCITADLP
ncbi:hypothetical protein C1646_770094 [Rhizophagus diaphanus]|nr:hypothetical protein C1646_770094 [Rhizophagus diaphanus] [Rhizophagus sp. MUCL 43196]